MRLIMIGRAVPPPPAMAPSTHCVACRVKCLGEFGNGRGFAAGCPPMGDFQFSGLSRSSQRQHRSASKNCLVNLHHIPSQVCSSTRASPHWRSDPGTIVLTKAGLDPHNSQADIYNRLHSVECVALQSIT
jgi:hypothetical protein